MIFPSGVTYKPVAMTRSIVQRLSILSIEGLFPQNSLDPRSGPSSVCKGIAQGRRDSEGRSHFRPDGDDRNHARGSSRDRAEASPGRQGGYLITLPHGDRLGAMRGRREPYRAGLVIIWNEAAGVLGELQKGPVAFEAVSPAAATISATAASSFLGAASA